MLQRSQFLTPRPRQASARDSGWQVVVGNCHYGNELNNENYFFDLLAANKREKARIQEI
jgi:hypothetical protein